MRLKTSLVLLFIIAGTFEFLAQDIIHFKDGKKVEAQVNKVTSETIEYKFHDRPDGPTFEVNAREIEKIRFANGSTYSLDDAPVNDEIFYVENKRNIIKLHLFQLLLNTTEIGYEHVTRPGFSWEASIGVTGLGIDMQDVYNDKAVYVRVAPKFIKVPKTRRNINRTDHILKGLYFKPELMIGRHSGEFYQSYYDPITGLYRSEYLTHKTMMGSLNIVGGMQWIIGNAFSIDIFGGLGIGLFNSPESSGFEGDFFYNYYNVSNGLSVISPGGFSSTVGLKIGYLF